MAVLTAEELAAVRKTLREIWDGTVIDFDKPTVNAAIQEMEDEYQDRKITVSGAIDTATSPYVFTNAAKKKIGAAYYDWRFDQDKI